MFLVQVQWPLTEHLPCSKASQ